MEGHSVEIALVGQEEEVVDGQRRLFREQGEGHAPQAGGDDHPGLAGGNVHGRIGGVGLGSLGLGFAAPNGHHNQQQRHQCESQHFPRSFTRIRATAALSQSVPLAVARRWWSGSPKLGIYDEGNQA